jgi:ABC-2 type transport system ATP-binding protein
MTVIAHNLTKRFGDLTAVDSLSLSIAQGELFGLVGSDGAGKTTTLRMLTGVMDPTGGEAHILGHSCVNLEPVRNDIGYMSQRFGLYPDLTVAENIRFYADLFGVSGANRKVRTERLLSFSGLTPYVGRQAGRLSGGMKQKLGLCCALIHQPKALFLDEPTNGVDPLSRRDFWHILHELRSEGVTIVVTTAYLDEAERCDRVGLLHQGRLLACDTPETLTNGWSISLEDLVISRIEDRSDVAGLEKVRHRRQPPTSPHFRPAKADTAHPAVSLNRLSKRFGDFIAVDNISLTVPKGQIFGFLGPNGAGKSTTIRMLCGILPPSSGEGTVAGFDIAREPERIKENIGYMSQRFSLYEDLTVEENIAFYAGVYRLTPDKRRERTSWVITMAGLTDRRSSRAGELSGGWRQRLALGCAILHEPAIIFLDEPTAGVDPLSRRKFWELIYSLADSGVTVFVTTHYMDEAENCDCLALIYRGRLVAIGTPEELKRERATGGGELPRLEDVFIGLIEETALAP